MVFGNEIDENADEVESRWVYKGDDAETDEDGGERDESINAPRHFRVCRRAS